MKKILSILLAVLIIAQMMVNVGIGVYYHLNRAYIANQLCINKNNPALRCNGHCYLALQLKKAEQREKQSTQVLKNRFNLVTKYGRTDFSYFPPCSIAGFVSHLKPRLCTENNQPLIKPPSA